MQQKNNTTFMRAFSLVELMTVIAIIGILSAVVLTSLSGARNSARDKSATASMQSIAIEAMLYRGRSNGSFANMCSDATVQALRTKAGNDTGNAVSCNSTATTFISYVRLRSGSYYCVDSTKFYGTRASAPGGGSC